MTRADSLVAVLAGLTVALCCILVGCEGEPTEPGASAEELPIEKGYAAVERIDSIQVPTLIITAEHDLQACREIADLLTRIIHQPSTARRDVAQSAAFAPIGPLDVPPRIGCHAHERSRYADRAT